MLRINPHVGATAASCRHDARRKIDVSGPATREEGDLSLAGLAGGTSS